MQSSSESSSSKEEAPMIVSNGVTKRFDIQNVTKVLLASQKVSCYLHKSSGGVYADLNDKFCHSSKVYSVRHENTFKRQLAQSTFITFCLLTDEVV